MSALHDALQRDTRDAEDLARACSHEVDDNRIDDLEKANVAFQDEITYLIAEIERVSKERDDWRERYEMLVEVTARRIDQANHGSC